MIETDACCKGKQKPKDGEKFYKQNNRIKKHYLLVGL